MEQQSYLNRRFILLMGAVTAVVILLLFLVFHGPHPINPNRDKLRPPDAGLKYAMLYKVGPLYEVIDQNDEVLRNVENDMLLFAHATSPKFSNTNVLVGFTFDKDAKKEGNTSILTGYYYGLGDKIQVKVTPQGRGVYTLSVTNLHDKSNIDNQLSMNGQRNRYIAALPVEKGHYSIRYQLTEDRVVVSFYDGYKSKDVDEAVASITAGLGKDAQSDVVYSINGVGIVSVKEVRQNLVTPLPKL